MGFHLGWRNLVSLEGFDRSSEGEGSYTVKAIEYYYILAQHFLFNVCMKK